MSSASSPTVASLAPLSCSGSATSSTLIVTPLSSGLRERAGVNLKITLPMNTTHILHEQGKGFIQPHISNLPRRRKQPIKKAPSDKRIASQPPSPAAAVDDTPVNPSPVFLPTLPQLRIPSLPQTLISNAGASTSKGHLQPHVTNLPRRQRKALTDKEIETRRRKAWVRRRCLQEVGPSSGVFVAFSSEDCGDEAGERDPSVACIVAINGGGSKPHRTDAEDGSVLSLFVSEDVKVIDGMASLSKAQLRTACEFLHRLRTDAHEAGSNAALPRVLITTPREFAADAMALAVCYLASHPSSSFLRPHLESSHTLESGTDMYSPVHSLLMHLHDIGDEDDAHGLKSDWRGVLSTDGMDALVDVCTN